MTSKVIKNYIYNIVYQIAVLIIPLITAPYLARILGAEGIGIYSYNYSIAYYFSLFVMLGVNNYGNRSIAKCLGEKKKIHKVFWEIYFLQVIMGIIVIGFYMLYVIFLCDNKIIALCYIPFIVSYMLDINWYYFGQENFKIILIRNIVMKVFTAILIFTMVKSKDDVIKYILIMSIGALVNQLVIWGIIAKERSFIIPKWTEIMKHFRANLVLFIPTIAVSIYRTMDKIMLGTISDMIQVGYYENSEKITSILLTFITALGTVMLPRMTSLFEEKENEKINEIIEKSFLLMSFIVSVVTFGIGAVANNLVTVYFGKEYMSSGLILEVLCLTVPFISYANIIRMQIIVPQSKDNIYIASCITGAIVNVIFNAILIPKFYAVGAAIGTVIAEFSVFAFQYFSIRKSLKVKKYILKTIMLFWVNGLTMFGIVRLYLSKVNLGIFSLINSILIGAVSYSVLIVIQVKIFKDEYLNELIKKISKKIKSNIVRVEKI